ncbi:hypothetical protein LCGC14_2173270 [marine sediment metagenome]|uniref:Uncharacterized protein n=1 Tax=marine sediment metagenome TaxID=412755 RepID=A0A0F9EBK9_9ZZZZ
MLATKLSPEEKKRLERYILDLKRGSMDFIARQKLRIILTFLGALRPKDKMLQWEAQKILRDIQPFKEQRLRKLINGRRPRQ